MKGTQMKALPVEPSNVPVAIGSRIRAARQSQRLTIEQVADATGLTKGFLSRVERDLTSPSVASLVTLCQVLSISIGDLFAAPETHLTKDRRAAADSPFGAADPDYPGLHRAARPRRI
jgi:transcriptional regulator with XRE-family HTH domain